METKTISQNISMLVYMKCFSFPFFFIRETTLISNPCLFNQNKDGNDCKGNFTPNDVYESNKSWTISTVYSISQFQCKNEVLISMAFFFIDNDNNCVACGIAYLKFD